MKSAPKILVDTLFVVALANELERHPLLITDAVLLEIGNALARNYKQEAVAVIEQFLSAEEAEIVSLTPGLFDEAFALYRTHQDKAWGLVDCISFVVMRERGVDRALTFDQHFVQAGFKALMRSSSPT